MRVGRHHKQNFYLNQQFTAYLQSKNLAAASIKQYTWDLTLFLAWVNKPETSIIKTDVLKYLEHLKNNRQLANITRKNTLIVLNHYFTFLLTSGLIKTNPTALLKIRGTKKTTLYNLYTPQQLEQLLDDYQQLFVQHPTSNRTPQNRLQQTILSKQRNAAILSLLIYQGITTTEISKLQLHDIDFIKATITIKATKKRNQRILHLKAVQIGLLMHYINNIRPQLLTHNTLTNQLFLSTDNRNNTPIITHVFKSFANQLKNTDSNFINYKQLRASVITNWLKTEGLRKTQYYAGHRHISSTEKYATNNLQELISDIDKLHPF